MPSDVINRLHIMARRNPGGLKFSDRHLTPYVLDLEFPDDDNDSTYVPEDTDNESANDDYEDGSFNERDDENDAVLEHGANDYNNNADVAMEPAEPAREPENDLADDPSVMSSHTDPNEVIDDDNADTNDEGTNDDESINDNDADEAEGTDDNDAEDIEQMMNDNYGVRMSTHNLRPRKPRDYGHLHTILEHTVMTQYSVNKGLKIFGESGVEAILQELQQLHGRKVIEPVMPSSLSYQAKKDALPYLMFLKRKRTGKIKGRGCADGRKQRETLTKEEVSSPTVAIESVLLSCTIDAHESRDVATVDIPGAFMQADMDDVVHMRIEGSMADLLIRLDPDYYGQFVETKGNKKVLYLLLKKALYGTLKAALLFWKKLSSILVSWGFEINPYDTCVANKTIDGDQCTILWHVDDLKISHVNSTVVTNIIEMLSKEFGNEAPLTVTRGAIHDYLGMTLDFSERGIAKIDMKQYITNILDEMPIEMAGGCTTPAANHLFEVDPEAEKLNDQTKEFFHHVTAQLLFLCKRARPDIQTAIAFLCTRVQHPDCDDYKKLARVIKYLRSTTNIPLRLQADSLKIAKWWVDASYAVHPDMKSHTGGLFSLGKGGIYGTSTRQKINAKSSTEAELIGVAEVLPQILWTQYFLEAQGYTSKDTIIYQDNKSAILLENNGKASSSKRTRHINIRYYFVTDRIANGDVHVFYCPTKQMIADFFTKPLQGSAFTEFRDFIMNAYDSDATTVGQNHRSVLKEQDIQDGGGLLNTVCGYMGDDGFTIVTRKHRNRRTQFTRKT